VKHLIRLATIGLFIVVNALPAIAQGTKYIRYELQGKAAYGILEGETVRELSAAPWSGGKPTGRTTKFAGVKLLAPAEPSKVIAAGLNYKSHIGQQAPAKYVGLFAKFPTSIIGHEADIPYPADATDLHFEGELVVVIGKKTSKVSREDALSHVFGVTVGNDVSERAWQKQDLQWFRAKASDGFGPLGPWIVTGINYQDALLERPDLRYSVHRELRQPVHHDDAGRCHLHGNTWHDECDEAGRCRRSGDRRDRRATQQGGQSSGNDHTAVISDQSRALTTSNIAQGTTIIRQGALIWASPR
jgi:2-keto-4-pentenoate hydratase/2-oxohepta-3-ene-1,7-dioic acid hydratase in catechol pathway